MDRTETQLMMWETLFAKCGIECDLRKVEIPQVSEGGQIVVVPLTDVNRICELFTEKIRDFGLAPFIAPGTRSRLVNDVWESEEYQFSDLVPTHKRTAEKGAYAFLARCHVREENGVLMGVGDFDSRMTVVEAFLYHLMMLEVYGEKYLDLHFAVYHCCRGSCTTGGANPGLRWDLQDIKVCLDLY